MLGQKVRCIKDPSKHCLFSLKLLRINSRKTSVLLTTPHSSFIFTNIELLELGAKSPELLEAYKKVLKEWLKIKLP
jgi:hypothetical protein